MSGAHDINNAMDKVLGDADSPPTLDYERSGEPQPSTRDMVEFGLMGLVYFLLPLLLLFVLQALLT